ncbi:MAG: chorismate-binding protein [Thermoflavifilum sp.]|nr:chorismate-binding protein [Thermoflavifilum sp.]MCL6515290.1 chorismate-binding protein [Alicyclobacillus sp.]
MPRSQQAAEARQTLDPFYLFLDLRQHFAEGEVFLLDAAADQGDPRYRMSVIGVAPLLEVQVKDGTITLAAVPGLYEVMAETVRAAGFAEVQDGPSSPTVIRGTAGRWRGADPMAFLEAVRRCARQLAGDPQAPFASGFLGYIGYDAVHYLERLPKTTRDDRGLPDVRLQWHAVVIQLRPGEGPVLYSVMDPLAQHLDSDTVAALCQGMERIQSLLAQAGTDASAYPAQHPVLAALAEGEQAGPTELVDDVDHATFLSAVQRAKAYIEAGDIFQVVLSKRMHAPRRLHPYVAYERLRRLNPSPYMFTAEYPDMRLFGASPEVQFRAVGGTAEMKPIAGTSKGRGRTPEEDAALAERLLQDEKERAEHVMLVDLCRNDLGRVCDVGSVRVTDLMTVEPYSHLFHLVSTVRGRLRPDVSVFHALLATFPAGTLSGAPKIRAMEIIDELESLRRGPYGGLIGMVDLAANANTAIIIRTVIECDGIYYVQAGAGIVADSDPEQEWLECGRKAGALMDVLTGRYTG